MLDCPCTENLSNKDVNHNILSLYRVGRINLGFPTKESLVRVPWHQLSPRGRRWKQMRLGLR